jgi:hypothetical protein
MPETKGNQGFRFEKEDRAETKMVVDGFLYIDAEDFDEYGGWRMDTQFVHLMGSAYMMATGVGTPVEDAATTIHVPKAGTYHVWVRARNWVKSHSPGRFQVAVNGETLKKEFGAADTDQWTWEKGGTVKLDGETTLALQDLTGFYGRCDAILLTTDSKYVPPEDKDAVCKERARLQGLSLEPEFAGEFDVIVVGGGSAGVPAAVAAARMGAKTALIQNRPTLGGNASVEAGVGLLGAGGNHPGWRESGIIEEASWIREDLGQINYSEAFLTLATAEPNLTLFMNQHVFEAVMDNESHISGVKSVSTLTGLISEYKGTMFIDCSGDGWLGYYAGAEYRRGREAGSEFNESKAPEKADGITMSGCIMGDGNGYMTAFRTRKNDHPVEFVLPDWVRPIEILESPHRSLRGRVPDVGTWWMEHPGDIDDTFKAEEARDELIKVTLAFWDYVKNRSDVVEKARTRDLEMIPILDAKRESRRLVGDYMVNQNDVESARLFDDRITYCGWDLDIHHPEGIYSGEGGSLDFKDNVPLNSVPYRSIYSKNIENLFMAGRCMSYTHVALGTVRVQSTLATVGQAAGTAAAICVDKGLTPRSLGQKHIGALQQILVKNDQTIQGIKNEDPNDLARKANVTASSYEKSTADGEITIVKTMPLNMDRSVVIPVEGLKKLKSVSVYLESEASSSKSATMQLFGLSAFANLDDADPIGEYRIKIPANSKGWIDVQLKEALPKDTAFLQVTLPQTSGVNWPIMAGIGGPGGRGYKGAAMSGEFHAVKTDPQTALASYRPENVINGWTRLAQHASSMWNSDPMQPLPQWVELDLGKPTALNTIQLTFPTDPTGQPHSIKHAPNQPRDYELSVLVDGKWVPLAKERDNIQRFRKHQFRMQKAEKIRLTVSATHGAPSAGVFEIRAYNE